MSYQQDYDERDMDIADMRRESQAERRRRADMLRHPDPRDPDHPGDDDQEDQEGCATPESQ